MSWLFGVLDPHGVDVEQVRQAAATMLVAGQPHVESRPGLAMGVLAPGGRTLGIATKGSGLLVADARVDAVGEASTGSSDPADAARALLEVLQAGGPDALDDVAADFALAWWDSETGQVVLARDATGTRPLYWGREGRRLAFASDPGFLRALDLFDGAIEVTAAQRFLAGLEPDPRETGIVGIRRVIGGRWLAATTDGPVIGGRWFRPESDPALEAPYGALVDSVEKTIRAAVADRARGERVGLLLSGGRDSGALSVALAREGISAACMTMAFDPSICPSEDGTARPLAEALGHSWTAFQQPDRIARSDVERLPTAFGTPLVMPLLTSAQIGLETARSLGCTTVMEGTGGDAFAASPIALLDLVRTGHPRSALRSAHALRRQWVHGYGVQAKVLARAIAPPYLLRLREKRRPQPPWAVPGLERGFDRLSAPRSSRELVVGLFNWLGGIAGGELGDRLYRPQGIRLSYPFRDRRVIRMLVGLPPEVLVPTRGPKPVLTDAFLGPWAATRVKASHGPWINAVAEHALEDFPEFFSASSYLARAGLVYEGGLPVLPDSAWGVYSLRLIAAEAWLRGRDP